MVDLNKDGRDDLGRDDPTKNEELRTYAPRDENTDQMTIDPLTADKPRPPTEIVTNLPNSNGGLDENGTVFPSDQDEDRSSPDNG